MNDLPDTLHNELLYFFTLGPSTGETVLLRVPPDQWVIIDSFRCAKRAAADPIVKKYGGRVVCIVLTHPHQDHHLGLIELVDNHAGAVLGCVHPRANPPESQLTSDPIVALKQGAKATYDRIMQEWDKNPARKWATFRRKVQPVGDATLTSLHPTMPVAPALFGAQPNEVSSAILVEWRDLRLLLGADVPNTQWPGIARDFPNLGTHAAMKVPHHGSREAIHRAFGGGATARCWIVTPFSSQQLPGGEDGDGLDRILTYVDEVHLTALPFLHNTRGMPPFRSTRKAYRDLQRRRQREGNPRTNTLADLNRHVMVAFDQTGAIQSIFHGAGSVVVHA